MSTQKQLKEINKKIDELKEEIWQLQLKKRDLNKGLLILGCPNTR